MWLPAIFFQAASASPALAETYVADDPVHYAVSTGSALEERPPILGSGRLSLGVGGGESGLGARLGAAVDAWPFRQLGLGLDFGWINQEEFTMFGGTPATSSFATLTAGPTFRTGADSLYLQLRVTGGIGFGGRTEGTPGCILGECNETAEGPHHEFFSPAFAAHLGLYWHPNALELGPFFQHESLAQAQMTTLGFAIGAVIR